MLQSPLQTSPSGWSPEVVIQLASGIGIVTLVSLGLATVLLWKKSGSAEEIIRVFGVILIIAASISLLVIGYDKDQISPVIGLFGAALGYLLGKSSSVTS